MNGLHARWQTYIDGQHRQPHGPVGRLIGNRMLRQHTPETDWTLDMLAIRPADRVLELGFGAGRGLALAAQRASEGFVVGLDRSGTMIAAARRRNNAAVQAHRMALIHGDLATLPLGGAGFDKMYSVHTLYFWPDKPGTLAELAAMLRPGGVLAVTVATGAVDTSGVFVPWPLHDDLEKWAAALRERDHDATLAHGPNSRQFNNVAIVVRRAATER